MSATLSAKGSKESTFVSRPQRISMHFSGHDLNQVNAVFVSDASGLWTIRVDAWFDLVAMWRGIITKKPRAGQSEAKLVNDLGTGAALFGRAAVGVAIIHRSHLRSITADLHGDGDFRTCTAAALSDETRAILQAHPVRDLLIRGKTRKIKVDRREVLYSSWCGFFPHSNGGYGENGELLHDTFKTVVAQLNHAQHMGLDMVYLPPIHPIGEISRKGHNNTLTPESGDVGSLRMIGFAGGGHNAIHPSLGDEKDFREFIKAAKERNLEVAIDLAFQRTPNHPWAKIHPKWFAVLPDGTVTYARNPPKKYQDIHPLSFDNDAKGLYAEVLHVMKPWVERGVKVLRVDNPHTKSGNFWEWLIETIHETNPEVIFLVEILVAPARLYGLIRAGFTQSYIYFPWKITEEELTELSEEITRHADIARPPLWTNTLDILHDLLVKGDHGAFAIRTALVSTLSPLWGMYSGFKLFESVPVKEGSEGYLDGEKYQLRSRDYDQALTAGDSLELFIATLNKIRREHPALQQLRSLYFHGISDDSLLAYPKLNPVTDDAILVVLNLDPWNVQRATVYLDMDHIGLHNHDRIDVTDLITDSQPSWGKDSYVRLAPWENVTHILKLSEIDAKLRRKLVWHDVPDREGQNACWELSGSVGC